MSNIAAHLLNLVFTIPGEISCVKFTSDVKGIGKLRISKKEKLFERINLAKLSEDT